MAINLKFLEQFEEFLRDGKYTQEEQLSKLNSSVIIIHYK